MTLKNTCSLVILDKTGPRHANATCRIQSRITIIINRKKKTKYYIKVCTVYKVCFKTLKIIQIVELIYSCDHTMHVNTKKKKDTYYLQGRSLLYRSILFCNLTHTYTRRVVINFLKKFEVVRNSSSVQLLIQHQVI